ncbi:hypothetical protein PanWU01x14_307120 [Parasponia andersonii]|uniref:Uncharacterized protein n=1 Tax=Parasponia andersonii TaxID=3476 RepID=A0A2P5ARG9_PARAD|nr:hypothetical protein PanWU01x14_307120 [Parasponia andersonii]
MLDFNQDDAEPAEVNNIDELLCESCIVTQDNFLVDDDKFEDDTLEEYDDKEIEIVDNDICSEENNNISDGSAPPGSRLSSDGSDPKGKRVREEMRGITIEKKLRREKFTNLKMQHDERTGKPILKHGQIFLNSLIKLV